MACPNCGCQVTYRYDNDDIVCMCELERCANCGEIFDAEMSIDDDEITDCNLHGTACGGTDGECPRC